MRSKLYFLLACSLAAIIPFLASGDGSALSIPFVPDWPNEWGGRPLKKLPLSSREEKLAQSFPGHIARFTDGTREIVVRWTIDRTRQLHPSSDCFEATGYSIKPLPIHIDEEGRRWAKFLATKNNEQLHVYERISDLEENSWTDMSSWYWASLFGKTTGPWMAITIAEKGKIR